MNTINTATELACLNDLSEDWKIVARDEPGFGWRYCGELDGETQTFRRLAFPTRGEQPHISVVTGRGSGGKLTLYARIFPVAFREHRGPERTLRHIVSGQR